MGIVTEIVDVSYRLSVNYRLSVEKAIKRANIDSDSYINSKNFPTKRKGKSVITIRLVQFNRMISSDDVLKELDQIDYRPAELHELLALLKEDPDLLEENFPIAALGSLWRDPYGDPAVPCFLDLGHKLALNRFKGNWPEFWRFAAVRK